MTEPNKKKRSDEILQDGERLVVPMTMMDSVQRESQQSCPVKNYRCDTGRTQAGLPAVGR